ncbi:hypothetical protein ACFWR9_30340 [Streptomyces sp. NPDC058534]|uniref:hypothetical protein n=1 Tax=Streptomyces sp. NPDC058534 TaxID=3346541 RepID=UPI0036651F77
MAQIPGASEKLDRLGRILRARMVELIGGLTPGSDLGSLLFSGPRVVEWREPLRHEYWAQFRGERPASVRPAEAASRAAVLLDSAQGEVAESQENDGPKRWYVVTGRQDGSGIEVRVSGHTPTVVFTGRTPAMLLYGPQEFRWPEPVCTPETVSPGYVLCYECEGLGACPGCGGHAPRPSPRAAGTPAASCATRNVSACSAGAPVSYTSQTSRRTSGASTPNWVSLPACRSLSRLHRPASYRIRRPRPGP